MWLGFLFSCHSRTNRPVVMGRDEKKSSYCSLQTDKLLASPWGHGPLYILTALYNHGRK